MPLPYVERKPAKYYEKNFQNGEFEKVPLVFKYRDYTDRIDRSTVLSMGITINKFLNPIITSSQLDFKPQGRIELDDGRTFIIESVKPLVTSYTVLSTKHTKIIQFRIT